MNIKSYTKPELEIHSLFAQESIANVPYYEGSDSLGEGSSSVFIENGGGKWDDMWD